MSVPPEISACLFRFLPFLHCMAPFSFLCVTIDHWLNIETGSGSLLFHGFFVSIALYFKWAPILFPDYLPLSLLPSASLRFPAAMPPSCLRWGSCCGRWSHTHPPCKILPVHISPAAQQWHPQLSQLYRLSRVQVWNITERKCSGWYYQYVIKCPFAPSLASNTVLEIQTIAFKGCTWQDPCREDILPHLHSLCPTLLHFQYTLDAHLHPFLRPTAMLVCSIQLHECGQPAQSLCMYTVHKRQGQKQLMVNQWYFLCGAFTMWEIGGWRTITSCLCHLPQLSPLHHSLWPENTPPPGLHH